MADRQNVSNMLTVKSFEAQLAAALASGNSFITEAAWKGLTTKRQEILNGFFKEAGILTRMDPDKPNSVMVKSAPRGSGQSNADTLASLSPELKSAVELVRSSVEELDKAIIEFNKAHKGAETTIWLQTAWMTK